MALNIGDNFSYLGAKPLDNRETYATKADLTAVNLNTVYEGMVAYVKSEDKYYRLKGTTWVEFSSGSSGVKEWLASTAYAKYDMVVNGGVLYFCTTAHTSGSSFDATEKANWQEVGSGGAGITDWVSTKEYKVGDIVYYNESLFKCNTAHTSSSAFNTDEANWILFYADISPWLPNTYYVVNACVIEDKKLYQCKTAHTSGTTFSNTNWNLIASDGGSSISTWVTSKQYSVDDIVIYANSIYKCNTIHTSSTFSTDASKWDLVYADLKNWAGSVYYSVGTTVLYNNKIYTCDVAHTATSTFNATEKANWTPLCISVIKNWQASTTYDIDDVVIYNGSLFKCTIANTSSTFNASNFSLITSDLKLWSASTNYVAGVTVINDGLLYRCNTTHISGSTFDATEKVNWSLIGKPCIYTWQASYMYDVGDLISINGSLFRCSIAHTSNTTFSSDITNWTLLYADTSPWQTNTYYIVNASVIYDEKLWQCNIAHTSTSVFDDTKWTPISGTDVYDWASSTKYRVGNLVTYGGNLYKCTTAHTSTSNFEPLSWDIIGNFAPATAEVYEVGVVSWQYALLDGHLALDGSTVSSFSSTYSELYSFFVAHNILTTVLADYTANKALCYYDSSLDEATMPDFLDKTVWGGNTVEEKSAGLPEVEGAIGGGFTWGIYGQSYGSGAFKADNTISNGAYVSLPSATSGSRVWYVSPLDFKASRYDTIYGNSTTVQPAAIQLIPQIRYKSKTLNTIASAPENNYSTTEKRIGTWIDGKPIYQQTVQVVLPSATGIQPYSYIPSIPWDTLDTLIGVGGTAIRSDGYTVYHGYNHLNENQFSFHWNKTNGNLFFFVTDEPSYSTAGQTAIMTFKYTKV